jgi:hypothetical protein
LRYIGKTARDDGFFHRHYLFVTSCFWNGQCPFRAQIEKLSATKVCGDASLVFARSEATKQSHEIVCFIVEKRDRVASLAMTDVGLQITTVRKRKIASLAMTGFFIATTFLLPRAFGTVSARSVLKSRNFA